MTKRFNENYKTMQTRKFWCHYIGSDGNTPKRRSIELTAIGELLPQLQGVGRTPLWYEREEETSYSRTYVYYYLYAQLGDKVAVTVMHRISDRDLEQLRRTDADIEELATKVWTKDIERAATDEARKRCLENKRIWIKDGIEYRDRYMQRLTALCSFDNVLLSGSVWVSNACLRAFEEAASPLLSGLQEMRRMKMEEREARERERQEEARKRLEEEARKKADEERREQERLDGEAEKFKAGGSIAGADVVDLCRRYGIAIHLRTVHNLQQVIANINGKDGTCQYYRTRGKRRPQLDGCYKTATELYNYLQTA